MKRLTGTLLRAVVVVVALTITHLRTGTAPHVIHASAGISEAPAAGASRFGRFTEPMDIDGAVE